MRKRFIDLKIKTRTNIKMIQNLTLFILLIVFTFWFIFKDQDINELINAIKSANKGYILIAALLMLCVHLMESINVRAVLVALGEKNFSIFRALKYTAIGFFFSAITPAATGGQPVEIYYMSKDGIKTSNGTMAMLMQLCGFQIATIGLSLICAILNPSILKGGIIWFYLLGITINGCALTFMLLSVFSKNTSQKLVNFTLKLMKKFKVKNFDIKKKKLEEGLEQYSESSEFIKKNKLEFVKAIIRVTIQISIYHSIPYFIYRAFGLNDLSIYRLFVLQAILYTTVSGIPLPGAIGVSETLFLKLYKIAFGSLLSGAMLVYRFVSFYLYVIIFLIVVIITATKTKKIESEIDKNIRDIEEYKPKKKKLLSFL